jgi:hypothetical protein
MNIFKVIDYTMKTKQGIEHPDELMSELSFGFIEGYFITSFIILGLLTGASFWFGFISDVIFFKITFWFFLLLLIASIGIFIILKRLVGKISKKVSDTVTTRIKRRTVIDVEVKS